MSSTPDFRFDGRVAVVTGAGRGLGRAHALLLAERGAKVVVNDLGGTKEGEGSDRGPANDVVAEITAKGGTAVADTSDVGSEQGCHALVDTAVAEFGRVDIIVNNAGISRFATFPEADADNLERTLDVHLRGTWHTTRAAWPHMVKQGYGRVITTTSTGMFGLPDNLAYATAKGALIGFTRSLAMEAAKHGILVNCLAPNAITRPSTSAAKPNITTTPQDEAQLQAMRTELVAPMMAYLAHEDCQVNGEILVAGARRFARWFLAVTPGHATEGDPTIEDIAEHWAEINDQTGYYIPENLYDWAGRFMRP
ncbi:NAD(P)-dependent dehydrogenase (short-subunit alcohol dehydrogenase family) [Actinocorallia herbida]|uniref:NAD(P)-dependent dehydrogenase (Short-subunit alcohol dehydrogenase family) n=1 Tax=Actinocorallia herbida TaxID=58109 RepID=A0A3N1D1M9_9ACTN|nr:SDR family NAD(P)-dependent oxidoreductase [Actinocorallia herbida]ROO87429.1 NAD(P)-dependent dehydrogenase (short-subunit alcohol dehydrogenase family) [Actinocorallia herbida]